MDTPLLSPPREAHPGITAITAWAPIPDIGLLPATAFHVDGDEPMLIDTGIPPFADGFMQTLRAISDPSRLRWIFMTHFDPDHTGALTQVLEAAPAATILTTVLGRAKLGISGGPAERVQLVAPGETLQIGRRSMTVFRPPIYDAPETLGLFDIGERVLFCADTFGALQDAPAEFAEEISPEALHRGMTGWLNVDVPHLGEFEQSRFVRRMEEIAALSPKLTLSAHLPPCRESLRRVIDTAIQVQHEAMAAPLALAS